MRTIDEFLKMDLGQQARYYDEHIRNAKTSELRLWAERLQTAINSFNPNVLLIFQGEKREKLFLLYSYFTEQMNIVANEITELFGNHQIDRMRVLRDSIGFRIGYWRDIPVDKKQKFNQIIKKHNLQYDFEDYGDNGDTMTKYYHKIWK